MVYNNFILSFQLDPSIFNPFSVSSETDTDSGRPEEGDPYILAEDIPGYLLKSAIYKSQEVIIYPEQTIPIDIITEEAEEREALNRAGSGGFRSSRTSEPKPPPVSPSSSSQDPNFGRMLPFGTSYLRRLYKKSMHLAEIAGKTSNDAFFRVGSIP